MQNKNISSLLTLTLMLSSSAAMADGGWQQGAQTIFNDAQQLQQNQQNQQNYQQYQNQQYQQYQNQQNPQYYQNQQQYQQQHKNWQNWWKNRPKQNQN